MSFNPSAWNNKIKLTIDSSKVDEDLTNFPALMTLSSGSGQTSYDATGVFDGLTASGVDSNTVLLLHCDGPNTSTTFLDTSGNGHIMTANGNAQISTAQYVFDWSSGYFDDTGDSLTTPASNDWNIGSADFTIDFWIYITSTHDNDYIFDIGSNGDFFRRFGDRWDFYSDGGYVFQKTEVVSNSVWHHIALVRYSGTTKLYIDGVEKDSSSASYSFGDSSNVLTIGNYGGGGAYSLDGYLSEFRISKGVARWTSDFVVPTGPYGSSWDNRKKIAVTTTVSGVETELFAEIERWESVTTSGIEQAWLWTKVPTIVSGTDTVLYLYYDKNHVDNSEYIGDTGETPAQNVWDDSFVGIWHMAQDPNGDVADAIKDSTSNINHGTPAGNMTSDDLVDGKVGKALILDATDYVSIGSDVTLNITDAITIEMQANVHTIAVANNPAFIAKDHATSWDCILVSGGTGNLGIYINNVLRAATGNGAIIKDVWHHIVFAYDKDAGGTEEIKIYVDTQKEGAGNYSTAIGVDGDPITIGKYVAQYLDATVDETRISNTCRSESWLKATYYSNWDDLITYAEVPVTFTFTNPIPIHLSTVYGTSHTLQLITTVTGNEPSYNYDAVFYDASDDSQIGSTVSGTNSGQPASITMQTPSGVDYNWYMTATSSGYSDTSSTYNFTNRFLCSGTTEVDSVLMADIPVRLYRRSSGVLIGSTTSTSGGLFEIESTYNESHYVIAIHPTDSGTNALIYDHLTP